MHKHLPQAFAIILVALQIPYLSTTLAIIATTFIALAVGFLVIATVTFPTYFNSTVAHKFLTANSATSYFVGMFLSATYLATLFFFHYEVLAIIYGFAVTTLYCYIIPFILRHR